MSSVLSALGEVFSKLRYWFLSVFVSLSVIIIVLLWDNLTLLRYSWSVGSVESLFWLWWGLLAGTPHSMGWMAVVTILITGGLLGMITSMTIYAWRKKRTEGSWHRLFASTGGGALAAVLGIGCIACGPLLVGTILAAFGAAGLLLLLPFHGAELGIIAIVLLLYSTYTVSQIITAPATCAVE